MIRRRVLYVIDHQRPGRERWSQPEISTANVTTTGDSAAQELADRFWLTEAPVLQRGNRVRLRVWPEPEDISTRLAHDPDTEPAEGTWICEPPAPKHRREGAVVSAPIKPPAPRPCESCPYRQDVPSGVWHSDEYLKLSAYDRPTAEQPTAVFLCHQQNGRVCGGWAGCHDGDQLLALRFAGMFDSLPVETAEAIRGYESPVALWPSGASAAEHGLVGVESPGADAQHLMGKLSRQRAAS